MRPILLATAAAAVLALGLSCKSESDPPPPEFPQWMFEHWVWENEGTRASATALVDDYIARDIPVSAVIIDSPWETSYNDFTFDPALYPDAQGMVDDFHARGVRVMLWITSAVNIDSPIYAQAAANGYFLESDPGTGPNVFHWWKGDGSLVDYYNPDALAWWHSMMDGALALGIDGWKCDGTDPYAQGSFSPGAGRALDKSDYADAYYRDTFEYTRAALGPDRIISGRPYDDLGSGLSGDFWFFAPRDVNWAGWVGDQDGTFVGLVAALSNMRHSSDAGFIAFGSDIGGFRSDDTEPLGRSKEVFVRWTQAGALSPVMENGGGGEHRPWMFDAVGDETLVIYRNFTKLHHALVPYLAEEAPRSWKQKKALMRFLDGDDDRWTLGPDVFVTALTTSGGTATIQFPAGNDWTYLFDRSETHAGGTSANLVFPLAEFPVYVRPGSAVDAALAAEGF